MIYNPTNPFEREKAKAYFEKLINSNKTFELTEKRIPVEEDTRTGQQNKTIHFWFSVLADELGYLSKEDLKRDVKRAILGQKECMNHMTGKIELQDFETHLMSVTELRHFMDKLKIWAQTEHGCYLPYYNDVGYKEMVQEYKNR